MGQHKYNPNCKLAREGKLPPKPKKLGKREAERLLYAKCAEVLYEPLIKPLADLHDMLPRIDLKENYSKYE